MANSNFQDVVVVSSDTLKLGIERLAIGSSAGSKSIVFAQDAGLASAMHLVASNPTAARTAILPDANGTIAYLTAISAGAAAISNGQIVFSDSHELKFGLNVSTVTAQLTRLSYLEVGANLTTAQNSLALSISATTSVHTATSSLQAVSGMHINFAYPISITQIEPLASQALSISASQNSGSWTISATAQWWCGLYTFSGSTAGVVSSVSSSSTMSLSSNAASLSSSISFFGSFTNITWIATPGEYMLFTGKILSFSGSFTQATSRLTCGATMRQNLYGVTQAEASFTIPFWGDGTLSASATSYHLTNLLNSGGGASTTMAPYVRLIGS